MKITSCFLLLALSCATGVSAASLSGNYILSMKPTSGAIQRVFLTLPRQGQEVSGTIAFASEDRPVPIENVQEQGDLLSFSASDNLGHKFVFQLSARMGRFGGEATSQGRHFQISPDHYFNALIGVSAPKVTYRVEPEYTEEARQANCKGTVLIYAQISREGKAINARVLHSVGCGLDEKALAAVAEWRYAPAMKDGNPSIIEAQIFLDFHP